VQAIRREAAGCQLDIVEILRSKRLTVSPNLTADEARFPELHHGYLGGILLNLRIQSIQICGLSALCRLAKGKRHIAKARGP